MKAIVRTLVVLALFSAGHAAAQGYPNRPIKIIVPFPPGQSVDVVARLVNQPMSQSLGQPVIVDNRPGAGGAIGISALVSSAPDGYTLLIGSSGPLSINPHLQKVPFDSQKSFTPVSLLATLQYVLVTLPSFPVASPKELITLVKASPGKYNFGASGSGTTQHLAAELFKLRGGLDAVFIPYAGSTATLAEVMSGRIDYAFETITTALPLIQAGRLKALGVTSLTRSNKLPEVPTIAESTGLADYNVVAWIGLLAPAGTPAEASSRLAAEVQKALQANDVRERFMALGMDPVSSTPAELARVMHEASERFGDIIKRANIKLE